MRKFSALLLCLCLWAGAAVPQNSAAQAQVASQEERIEFSAGTMSGSMKEGQDYTKLSGNAKIKTEGMEIQADDIELYGRDFRFIKAEGSIQGVQQKDGLFFTCSSMEYDRQEKIAVFNGNVVLDDQENDVVAKAQRIEYREQESLALMQIDVELTQEDSVCTCAFALYRKDEKLLEMTGNPQVRRGEDVFRAQEILFNLDTEEITMVGRVHGSVTEKSGTEKKGE